MKTTLSRSIMIAGATAVIFSMYAARNAAAPSGIEVKPDAGNAGLILPAGFGALVAADTVGGARHIAVTKQGDLYVKLSRPRNGKSIIFLKDKDGDGKFEEKTGFAGYSGTGIAIKDGYLYASSNTEVFRYKLDGNERVVNTGVPEKIVTGLIDRRQHETKSLALDNDGNIYVNIGAFSNSCQIKDREKGSKGRENCPVLDSAGGIWQFRADKLNQQYSDGTRYATGLRNVVGLDWNQQNNTLFVMQHGRDMLNMFPEYNDKQSAELPAECMFMVKKGTNGGWPYIYYDPVQKKNILAPEYGGDGKKEGDPAFTQPVAAYPAHMAPNGLLFYTGTQFPAKYRNGAFIAFHGSWNRAPEPQAGYFVVFQPFKDGKPFGDWEVFADNFSGSKEATAAGGRSAQHRPCGLAQGPDGSLYVSDDSKGTIYRIVYRGK
ncbi:PQQ-dependent sugar dehydrogenase [Hufsiella ginkgonis]|uniref:Sorbosone dehydrogenase n=1 Tax=Hufsiella ginkgonis TaxID=2695274 RepID=A0A7K1XXZ1_9SPHI|nr:PQQ-dependent sugar dehydrogenase [Hufsiella ginkgonis]MXV15396.1 sorbosone dehydrogenase [Hufsiella ginkgonis]